MKSKKSWGGASEEILDRSDASVQGAGGKKLWVVYENPFESAGGCHAGSSITAKESGSQSNHKKYLLASLNLRNPEDTRDVVVMYNSPEKTQRNRWRGIGDGKNVDQSIMWKGANQNSQNPPNGWTPTHAVLCIPKSANGKTIAKKETVVGHGYNPNTGKCQNHAITNDDLRNAEQGGAGLKDADQVGMGIFGKAWKRKWAQKWWDQLTWVELK